MVECWLTNEVVVGTSPVVVIQTSDIAPVSNKEFLDIQATTECGFCLKLIQFFILFYILFPFTVKIILCIIMNYS